MDLRGHGYAPRAATYRISDFAADVEATTPAGGGSWDVVIGHSIGAAAAVVAAHNSPQWDQEADLARPRHYWSSRSEKSECAPDSSTDTTI